MSADDVTEIQRTIASIEQQERDLVLATFTHDDAWRLGCLLVELGQERDLPITVDIQHGTQQVFHAALPGTTADNDSWVARKVRVVLRFGAPSYLVGLRAKVKGTTFNAEHDLPLRDYAAHGGAFPIRVRDVGVVGVVTVSGLPQAEDHALVVEALTTHLEA